ncbi:hypothetical protein ACIBBG_33785 [Micromonospora chersina]|uniref:hypothetical protein n=1 Tax=Micromonospora chersina TaxID=47854 RepID=UPI0037911CC8
MTWRTRLRILADAAAAAVLAMRRPDPAAEATRNEREHERLAELVVQQETSTDRQCQPS